MTEGRKGYRTLIVSGISAFARDGGFVTDGLWARDINANAEAVARLTLICPVGSPDRAPGSATPLHPEIEVIAQEGITDARIDRALAASDVVELPGNGDWTRAAFARRVLGRARAAGTPAILGLSSNRIATTLMNARGASWATRLRARLRAASIRMSQAWLMRRTEAVRIVGRGLLPLVEGQARKVHIDTASWITEAEIAPLRPRTDGPARVIIASRLEPMKGVALGVEAVAGSIGAGRDIALAIYGQGAEEAALRVQVETLGIAGHTAFMGQVGYPGPFFEALSQADYVLLTNLNDEQPRLIFDAISQGAVPVCPHGPAYAELGLDPRVFYDRGDAASLQTTLQALIALPEDSHRDLMEALRQLAHAHTIEAMHAHRANWIAGLLAARA